MSFFLEFVLIVGLALSANDDGVNVVIVIHGGDDIVMVQHVLIEQIANRQPARMVTNGHDGDDFLIIQIDGEGFLLNDMKRDGTLMFIPCGEGAREGGIMHIRYDNRNILLRLRRIRVSVGFF